MEWPECYSMPPFFTIQPVAETRAKQMKMWIDLIIAFQKANGRSEINTEKDFGLPLFKNSKINRSLSVEGIRTVLEDMVARGYGEWQDDNKIVCSTTERSVEDWAQLIYKWATVTGQTSSICTLFEIIDGEVTEGEEFHGLEQSLMLRALRKLEKAEKVTLVEGGTDSEMGVKFL